MEKKAPNNRTLTISKDEYQSYKKALLKINEKILSPSQIKNKIINGDTYEIINYLPTNFVDLLFIDPPYNLSKNYNGNKFEKKTGAGYKKWVEEWLIPLKKILKPTASIYICGYLETSAILQQICDEHFNLLNRITIERDKGRGSEICWKNNSEDIWFCSNTKDYYFNADAVKLRRRVIAPYKVNGNPKDWEEQSNQKFRLTYPSNIWTDITIPFWSMSENTPHPTQKPEKLLAKVILASSREGDFIFDPFGGVGTTAVVAKKLGRNFTCIEKDEEYCIYAQKRLKLAETNKEIQGYSNGVFLERNAKLTF